MGGCCASKPKEDAAEESPAAAATAAPPAAEPNTGEGGGAAAAAGDGAAAPEGRTPDSDGGVTVKVVRKDPSAGLGMQFEGVLDEATGAGHLLVGAVSPKKVAGQHGLQDFTGQCLTHVNDAPIRDVTDLAQFRGVEVLNMRFVPTETVLPSPTASGAPPPQQQQHQQQQPPQKALPSAPATPHAAATAAEDDGPPPPRLRWKRFAPPPNPLEGAQPQEVARMVEEEAARAEARAASAGGGGGSSDAEEAGDAAVLAEMELNLVFPDGRDGAEILHHLSGSAAAAHDADVPAVDGRRLSPTALLTLTLYAMDGAEIDAALGAAAAAPGSSAPPSEDPRNAAISLTDARWAHTARLLDTLARSGAQERRRSTGAEQQQQECFATLADPPASAVEAWRRRDGRCVAFSAPFSATTSVAMAEEALEQVVHSLVLFRMRTAVGVELGRFSQLPHEGEALVPAHTVLRVTGTSDEDIEGAALTVVYLEEVAESELLPARQQPPPQRASVSVAPSAAGAASADATSAATASRLGSSSLRLGSASAARSSRRDGGGGASTASPSPQQPAAGRRSHSRPAAAEAEAEAASGEVAMPDPAYEVEAPHKRRVEGTYVLAEGQTQEGLPVWRTEAVQEAEGRWAAYELSSTGGRWSIGKVLLRLSRRRGLVRAEPSSGDGRGAKIAAAKKTRTRDGREVPPDMVGAAGGWLVATKQQTWEYDHSVVVRAVSVTSPSVLPQQQQHQQQQYHQQQPQQSQQPQPAASEQPQRQQRFSASRDRQAAHRDAVAAAMDSDTSDATSATTAHTTASQSSIPRDSANTHPLLLAATFKRGSKKKKKAKAKANSPPRQSQGVQPSWHASFGMPQAKPSYPAPKRASAGSKPPSFYQPQLSLQGSPGQHAAANSRAAPRLATNVGGVLGGRGRSFAGAQPQTPVRYAAPPLTQSVAPPANSFAPPYDGDSQCAQYSFWQ